MIGIVLACVLCQVPQTTVPTWTTNAVLPEDYAKNPTKNLSYEDFMKKVLDSHQKAKTANAKTHPINRANMEKAAKRAITPDEKDWWRRMLLLDQMLEDGKLI